MKNQMNLKPYQIIFMNFKYEKIARLEFDTAREANEYWEKNPYSMGREHHDLTGRFWKENPEASEKLAEIAKVPLKKIKQSR